MKKSSASDADRQVKNALRQLHKMGLYDPKHPRRAPTKYAKSIVKKFTELGVIGAKPRAEAIKIPKSAAAEIGGEFRVVNTRKGAAAIVPKRHGVRTFYSKKRGKLIQKMGVYEFHRYHDSMILLRGEWPDDLKKGESIAVPVRSGFRKIKSPEHLAELMGEYDPGDENVNFWQWPYVVTGK